MPVRFAAACAAMLLMLPLSSADFDIGSLPELDPELTCGGCLEQSKTYCCGNFTIPPAQKQNRENVMNSQSGRTYAPGENVRCSCITKTGRMSAGRICLVKNFDTSLGTFPWYGRTGKGPPEMNQIPLLTPTPLINESLQSQNATVTAAKAKSTLTPTALFVRRAQR